MSAYTVKLFLSARIIEDLEAVTGAMGARGEDDGPDTSMDWDRVMGRPTVVVGAERVLADCQAKGLIADAHDIGHTITQSSEHDVCTLCDENWPCETMRALVHPYADHPDFDTAWAIRLTETDLDM
jgi:hypothetical protein